MNKLRPVGLLVLLMPTLAACWNFGVSVGDFPTDRLLLSIEAFPPHWDVSGPPMPGGPNTWGYGDEEDDRYLEFVANLGGEPVHAYQRIMQFRTVTRAERWFEGDTGALYSTFEDRVGRSADGATQLRYEGILNGTGKDLYGIGCTVLRGTRPRRCAFSARYDQFIVEFNSVIDPEVMTIQQFNAIVAEIDRIMVDNLDLSSEQNE